ncbi:BTAD domain-containing putative transcriptional regulator [Streptosporangium longisporum]|uniref:BTAD domain-containing putative transcriptional regulator n=1 Tax=Streptosporangium longisporum TaxID=46187 RepID=A0ABP6LAF3_9ACTN
MRFEILGTTRVWDDDGGEVRVGGPARRALLTLLLARAGETVPADLLVDDLYGERQPGGAAHALQSQVSRLRQVLDGHAGHAGIEAVPSGYRLTVDPGELDARRFELLADEGRAALRDGDPARAAALLREGLELWRGPALADAADASSVRALALRLEERRLGALEDRIEADLRRGEHRAAVPELQELTALHPLRERLRGLLMRALQAGGRQAEALIVFEETRLLLAGELGADPSAELADLHGELLRGERPYEPPVPPAQLTSFVGRAEDLAEVAARLRTARLVTLLGPGGAGKTRLSIEVASGLPDVCFVELAAVRDGRQVPHVLLGALGLREGGLLAPAGAAEPAARLVAALAARPSLLVLDNCEHVVGAVADLVARLLAGCPRLRVLATSREPLGITGENLWPVRPLGPLPAARLFTDRVSAVRPGLVLDEAAAEHVRRICLGLDGLPLAIELAAARARTYELAELAARLDDRFRLLSRGSRTADARHRTLRAVVEWSWDLLSEPERTMARRLTVFAGGASAATAARVCGVPDAEDLLDSLADRSLVEAGGGRYRMLDTIHAYCAERLEEAGETEALRRAHAGHFLALARAAGPHLLRSEQLRWLETLVTEHADLQAALRRAVEAGESGIALELLARLSPYLWMRGMRGLAAAPAAALLDLVGDDPPPDRGEEYVLCALAAASGEAGRQAWERHRATAEAIVADPARPHRHPIVTLLWPMITSGAGDPSAALSLIDRGRTSDDPWERAVTHLLSGYPLLGAGEMAAAEDEFTSAAEAFRSLGDRWGTSLALDALAGLAALSGDPGKAIVLTDEALVLTERLGSAEDVPDMLCSRADHHVQAVRIGKDPAGTGLRKARADYERAAGIARHAGSLTYLAAALRGLGDIARLEGDLAGARALYEQALERFETGWVRSAGNRAGALLGLGRIAEAAGDLEEARALHLRALGVAVETGAITEGARPVEALAGIAVQQGDARTAALLLGAAVALRGIAVEDDPEVSGTAAAARAALGGTRYDDAHREGSRLPGVDALRLAGVPEAVVRASPIGGLAVRDPVAPR